MVKNNLQISSGGFGQRGGGVGLLKLQLQDLKKNMGRIAIWMALILE